MKFTKMQGCGNDYVYINCLKEKIFDPTELARKVSDRHFGIGSDGLILILPSIKGDFRMDMYNADGSRGEMCGNAIRCVGKYVYEHGMTKKTDLCIETLAGLKKLNLTIDNKEVKEVTVEMGHPIFTPKLIPILSEKDCVIDEPILVNETEFHMTCLSVGNPHAVIFVEDVENFPLNLYGPLFESHPVFPKRVNTEFVQVLSPTEIKMRVWERGSGETFACGTGATASVCAGIWNQKTESEVIVHMIGGDLKIRYQKQENLLFMTGPAITVFEGEYYV